MLPKPRNKCHNNNNNNLFRMQQWMSSIRKCLRGLKATCHRILSSTHYAFTQPVCIMC